MFSRLIDKSEGSVEKLGQVELGVVFGRKVEIALDLVLGMVDNLLFSHSDYSCNSLLYVGKKVLLRRLRSEAAWEPEM